MRHFRIQLSNVFLHDLMPFLKVPKELVWFVACVKEWSFVKIMKGIGWTKGPVVVTRAAKQSEEGDGVVTSRFPKVAVLRRDVQLFDEIHWRTETITAFIWCKEGCGLNIEISVASIGTLGNEMRIKLAFVEPMTISEKVDKADILVACERITHKDQTETGGAIVFWRRFHR